MFGQTRAVITRPLVTGFEISALIHAVAYLPTGDGARRAGRGSIWARCWVKLRARQGASEVGRPRRTWVYVEACRRTSNEVWRRKLAQHPAFDSSGDIYDHQAILIPRRLT